MGIRTTCKQNIKVIKEYQRKKLHFCGLILSFGQLLKIIYHQKENLISISKSKPKVSTLITGKVTIILLKECKQK